MDFLSQITSDGAGERRFSAGDALDALASAAHGAHRGPLLRLAHGKLGGGATEHENTDHPLTAQLGDDVETTAASPRPAAPSHLDALEPRLRRGVVLRAGEESCEVAVEGRPVSARYVGAFPRPRTERVAPGHLVALSTAADDSAVVVFRWYDAVVLGTSGEQVQMWEPAHGEVLATLRYPDRHHRQGTRAYLSAGLPGAEWWLAGPVPAAAHEADVELGEVERFCTQHGLWG